MSSINNINRSSSYKGFSGLISGMDTESMVDKLLSGTQSKIDRQKAKMQQLKWKQEMYRDVIASVRGLKDNFFDFLKPETNIGSNAFFQSMSATTKSDKVSVIATSNAQAGKFKISSIKELATSTSLKSDKKVTGDIKLNIDEEAYKKITDSGKKDAFISFKVDGVEKRVNIGGITSTGSQFKTDLIEKINSQIKTTGVSIDSTGKLETGTRDVQISTESSSITDVIGVKNGVSNKINLKIALKDVNFGTELQGGAFNFKINGVEFNFTENDTVGDVIDKINSSNADVEVKYSSIEDKFVMTAKGTGAGYDIKIEQGVGNLMTAFFGDDSANSIISRPIDVNGGSFNGTINENALAESMKKLSKDGGVFKLNVNGQDFEIKVPAKKDGEYTTKEVVDSINKALSNKFGTGADGKAKIAINYDDSAKTISLDYEKGMVISIGAKADGDTGVDLAGAFGIKNKDIADIKLDTIKLTDLGFKDGDTITVGGQAITIDGSKTLQDLITAGGTDSQGKNKIAFDAETKTISVIGVDISSTNEDAMKNVFGAKEIKMSQGTDVSANVKKGTNAVFTVETSDGTKVDMEKNSNTFTIDGLTITLKGTTEPGETIEIETTKDTKQIFDGIVKFVDEYNKMVDKLNDLLTEKPEYSTHAPLTDKQKKELTDKEQELWEKKAKEGLLRGDSLISSMMSEMRSVFYHKPDGAKFALYDIGITTTSNWRDGGKLVIDETKLRQAIEENSGEVQKLFVGEDGISKNFEKVMDKYTKSSAASPGRLVEKAGIKGYTESKNQLSKEIEEIERGLKSLEYHYDLERARYWKQFNQMENVLQQMNAQSGWLMQQFQ